CQKSRVVAIQPGHGAEAHENAIYENWYTTPSLCTAGRLPEEWRAPGGLDAMVSQWFGSSTLFNLQDAVIQRAGVVRIHPPLMLDREDPRQIHAEGPAGPP